MHTSTMPEMELHKDPQSHNPSWWSGAVYLLHTFAHHMLPSPSHIYFVARINWKSCCGDADLRSKVRVHCHCCVKFISISRWDCTHEFSAVLCGCVCTSAIIKQLVLLPCFPQLVRHIIAKCTCTADNDCTPTPQFSQYKMSGALHAEMAPCGRLAIC